MIVPKLSKRAELVLVMWILVIFCIAALIPGAWYRVIIASMVGLVVGLLIKRER